MTIREISIAFALVSLACAGLALFWRAKSTGGWLKKSLRIVGALAILLAAFESLNWFAKRGSRMPAPVFTSESPDARFVAEVVEPNGDLIPTHLARISTRRSGHILAEEVFKGTVEPNVDWLDNRTLQLTYPAASGVLDCGGSWSGATIVCRQIPASQFKPRLRELSCGSNAFDALSSPALPPLPSAFEQSQ